MGLLAKGELAVVQFQKTSHFFHADRLKNKSRTSLSGPALVSVRRWLRSAPLWQCCRLAFRLLDHGRGALTSDVLPLAWRLSSCHVLSLSGVPNGQRLAGQISLVARPCIPPCVVASLRFGLAPSLISNFASKTGDFARSRLLSPTSSDRTTRKLFAPIFHPAIFPQNIVFPASRHPLDYTR